MSWSCGIVGLPNVGKSLLYNTLTGGSAEVANYPFCTLEPHVGVIPIADERLQWLGELYRPQRLTPATLQVVDIAGLVRGGFPRGRIGESVSGTYSGGGSFVACCPVL